MRIWDDESFGPSTTIIVVEDHRQAIRVVNESNYGLDAIVFTKDMGKAVELAQELQVGRVRVNSVAHEGKSAATSRSPSITNYSYQRLSQRIPSKEVAMVPIIVATVLKSSC